MPATFAPTFEWMYFRNGCKTCGKAQDFLSRQKIEAKTIVDARKNTMGPADALKLAKQVDEIYATKGTKVVHVNMKKDKPTDSRLVEVLIGPTGNLRAPTLRHGKKLLVGFDEASYKEVLKK